MKSALGTTFSRIRAAIPILLSFALMVSANVAIVEKGVHPVKSGDVAMVFYTNVTNQGKEAYRVRMGFVKCCLILPDKTMDCNAMKLHSGLAAFIQPNKSFNLTMYFVNQNLFDRKGECSFRIFYWKSETPIISSSIPAPVIQEDYYSIAFDTELDQPNIMKRLHSMFRIHLGGSSIGFRMCESPDLDPLQNCEEANCIMKYVGLRSFYNENSKLCDPTPDCFGQNQNKKIISPVTGKCRDFYSIKEIYFSISPEMFALEGVGLELEIIQAKKAFTTNITQVSINRALLNLLVPKVDCVNGHKGGIGCICDLGWTFNPIDMGSFSMFFNDGSPLKACNVLTTEGEMMKKERKRYQNIMALIAVGVLTAILLILMIWKIITFRKSRKNGYKQLTNNEDSEQPDDVITEISSRREQPIKPTVSENEISTPQYSYSPFITADQNPSVPENHIETPPPSSQLNTSTSEKKLEQIPITDTNNSLSLNIQKSHSSEILGRRGGFMNFLSSTSQFSNSNPFQTSSNNNIDSYLDGMHLPFSCKSSISNVNMDEILSLSNYEKLRTQSEPILYPSKILEPSAPKRCFSSNGNTYQTESLQSNISKPLDSPREVVVLNPSAKKSVSELSIKNTQIERRTDLTVQQKQEEWEKFLKVFTTSKISRRRSLCTTPENQIEKAMNYLRTATKVKSMPAMSINPFITKDNDNNKQSIPNQTFSEDDFDFAKFASSIRKIQESNSNENIVINPSLRPGCLNISDQCFSQQNETMNSKRKEKVASSDTSNTSIWSTVASSDSEPLSIGSRTTSDDNFDLPEIIDEELTEPSDKMVVNKQLTESADSQRYEDLKKSGSKIKRPKFDNISSKVNSSSEVAEYLGYSAIHSRDSLVLPAAPTSSSRLAANFGQSTNLIAEYPLHKVTASKEINSNMSNSDLDPYKITAKLKDTIRLRASKSRSLDSL